jgi:GDP-L-fucose synthase
MEKHSKVLITGANGLVGSALNEKLKALGYSNIIAIGRNECDLMNFEQTKEYFSNSKPDYVFHAAARVYGILGNMENKGLSFYENTMINTNVIEASRLADIKKITVMGTGAVYPFPPKTLPLKENEIFEGKPHPSEDSYANAKRAMLAMLNAYKESYNMEWAYIVSCNLFGPRDKFDIEYGHVVPALIKKFFDAKKTKQDVVVWGNGSAQRDFMYIKDVASLAVLIMHQVSGPINIGSGQVYRIKDIVEILTSISGMQGRVRWDSSKPNGQDYRAYDLSKIKRLGFNNKYSLDKGLYETWNWYLNNDL